MSSLVLVNNIDFLNPTDFYMNQMKIKFDLQCQEHLPAQINFKIIQISSAERPDLDQTLDSFEVGPMQKGSCSFVVDVNPPNPNNIPLHDILGITAMMISITQKEMEFFRLGQYVYNTIPELEQQDQTKAEDITFNLEMLRTVHRQVIVGHPRILRFDIDWFDSGSVPMRDQNGNMISSSVGTPQGATIDWAQINPLANGNQEAQAKMMQEAMMLEKRMML